MSKNHSYSSQIISIKKIPPKKHPPKQKKKPGPKKRLVKCDLSTKEGCQDAELEALKKHVGKSKNEIQATLKKLKKDSKQTLKPGQHEKIKADKESLKTVLKHLKANKLETFEL